MTSNRLVAVAVVVSVLVVRKVDVLATVVSNSVRSVDVAMTVEVVKLVDVIVVCAVSVVLNVCVTSIVLVPSIALVNVVVLVVVVVIRRIGKRNGSALSDESSCFFSGAGRHDHEGRSVDFTPHVMAAHHDLLCRSGCKAHVDCQADERVDVRFYYDADRHRHLHGHDNTNRLMSTSSTEKTI